MKYSLQKRISAFVLAFALVMTTAFNSIGATTKADAAAAKVKTLYLTKKVTSATVGDSFTAQWAVRATKATKAMAKVTVKSSDTSVVKVTKTTQSKKAGTTAKKAKKTKGTATLSAVGAGEAKITITTVKKTKKKKKLSKSFTVKVAAKETPASSETPASQDASKNPVAPKLEGITVTADTTEIGPGGQAQLTVKSTNEVGIASTTFKSSNEYIATVDENGVVTGRNSSESPVTITVTAKDTYGNTVTQTIQIKVIKLVDAKITLAEASKEVSLVVGQTHKISATVDPAGYTLTYKDYDPTVISVSADGTITALKGGKTDITVGAAGTNASAVVKVVVKSNSIAIADAYASKANQVTVVFTGELTAAERDALDIKLTYGSEQKVTVSFDASGNAILTKDGEFDPAKNYVVTIKAKDGKTLALDSDASKLTKTFEISAVKATTFEIKPSQVLPWGNNIKVFFAIKDQYGTPMKSITSNKCNIRLSCTEYPALGFTGQVATNADTDKTYADYPSYFTVNFKDARTAAGYTTATLPKTTIQVNGDLIADKSVAAKTTDISLEPLGIKSVKIKKVQYTSGEAIAPTQDDSKKQVYEIVYEAYDTNNQLVDLTAYEAYANRVNFNVTGYTGYKGLNTLTYNTATSDLSLHVIEQTSLENASVVDAANSKTATGKFYLSIPAGSYGEFEVFAAVGSSTDSYKVNVLSTAAPDAVFLADGAKTYKMKPSQGTAKGGDGQLAELKFKDQRGAEIAAPTADVFSQLFNIVGGATGKVQGSYYYDGTKKKGYLEVDTATAAKGEYTFKVTRIGENNDSAKNSANVTIDVGEASIANTIVLDKTSVKDSTTDVITLLAGEDKDIVFTVNDQYGTALTTTDTNGDKTPDVFYTFTASAAKSVLTATSQGVDLSSTVPVEWTGATAITSAADKAAAVMTDANSTGDLKDDTVAEKITVHGVAAGESTLTIGLKNGTTAVNNSVKTFKFKVITAPKSFKLAVDTTGALTNDKLVSGSKIKLNISALDNLDTTKGAVISDYAGECKSIKVYENSKLICTFPYGKFGESTDGLTSKAGQKGVLTLEGVQVSAAGDNTYKVIMTGLSTVSSVELAANGPIATANTTTVVADNASALKVDKVSTYDVYKFTFVDAGGNTDTKYAPKSAQVKVKVEKGGNDVTTTYFSGAYSVPGKAGYYIDLPTITNGVSANITADSVLPEDCKITFSIDGCEGSLTVTK